MMQIGSTYERTTHELASGSIPPEGYARFLEESLLALEERYPLERVALGATLRFKRPKTREHEPSCVYRTREYEEDIFEQARQEWCGEKTFPLNRTDLPSHVDRFSEELDRRFGPRKGTLRLPFFNTQKQGVYNFMTGFRFVLAAQFPLQAGLSYATIALRESPTAVLDEFGLFTPAIEILVLSRTGDEGSVHDATGILESALGYDVLSSARERGAREYR